MSNLLYILVKNPFTERDFERMGIAALEKNFDVRILDCTAWLMPTAFETRSATPLRLPNLHSIGSLQEFRAELKNASGGLAIDYVGQFSLQAILLFHYLKQYGFRLVVIDSGPYPFPKAETRSRPLRERIDNAIKNKAIQRRCYAFLLKLFLKVLPDQRPDFAFVSGTSWLGDPRFSRVGTKIPAHTFDYDKYLQVRAAPAYRTHDYAVYLDENIAYHEDNAEMGYAAPVSAHKFFGALVDFFTSFEHVSGFSVIVAGYPSQTSNALDDIFQGREIIPGKTAELIRNAKVVFAHASTAISYAVLWRRPIVFLTSDEMNGSWYQPWVESPRNILNSPLANIDQDLPTQPNFQLWQKVDTTAYQHYEDTYLKSAGSPEVSLWEIFLAIKNKQTEL